MPTSEPRSLSSTIRRLLFTQHAGRDALVSLSLANLCWIKFWDSLLFHSGETRYFSLYPDNPADYWAAIVNVFGFSVLFFAASCWMRRQSSRWVYRDSRCQLHVSKD